MGRALYLMEAMGLELAGEVRTPEPLYADVLNDAGRSLSDVVKRLEIKQKPYNGEEYDIAGYKSESDEETLGEIGEPMKRKGTAEDSETEVVRLRDRKGNPRRVTNRKLCHPRRRFRRRRRRPLRPRRRPR